jgi:hypothetical protein
MGSSKNDEVNKKRHPKLLSKEKLEKLIQHAIVDAYSETEQKTGFCVMLEEHLALPFNTNVLGVEVSVERIDMTADGSIVAVCLCGKLRQRIPILELSMPEPPPEGFEWIQAYRRWARGR